jgi:hypothetical protein
MTGGGTIKRTLFEKSTVKPVQKPELIKLKIPVKTHGRISLQPRQDGWSHGNPQIPSVNPLPEIYAMSHNIYYVKFS